MGFKDIMPKCEKLKKNFFFNNRFGCVLHVIDNYVKKRLAINIEDLFSFVSFNDKGAINFENFNNSQLNKIDLLDKCVATIERPNGGTSFLEGFTKANEILTKIDRNLYRPVFILLSDGLDLDPPLTVEYVKKVSKF